MAIVAMVAIVGLVAVVAIFFGRDFRGRVKLDRVQIEVTTTK